MDDFVESLALVLYVDGMSIPMVSDVLGLPRTRVRDIAVGAGVIRSRGESLRLAASEGRLGGGRRGKSFVFSEAHKNNISRARLEWGKKNAAGVSLKPSGYLEYTTGPNKGRSVHVVVMEKKIGRRLYANEVVHHKDGDRTNNRVANLELMTRAAHARLHGVVLASSRKRSDRGLFE